MQRKSPDDVDELRKTLRVYRGRVHTLEKTVEQLQQEAARRENIDVDHVVSARKKVSEQPHLVVDAQNKIYFANGVYTQLTGYTLPELQNTDLKHAIPQLEQLPLLSPALLALERLSVSLQRVPATILCKDGSPLERFVDIDLGSDHGDGYHGFFVYIGEKRNHLVDFLRIDRLFHRRKKIAELRANEKKYSHNGKIDYQSIGVEKDAIYQQPLFNDILALCIDPREEEIQSIAVDFAGIVECDPRVYAHFAALSRIEMAQGSEGLKLHLIRVPHALYKKFIHAGFPPENIQE